MSQRGDDRYSSRLRPDSAPASWWRCSSGTRSGSVPGEICLRVPGRRGSCCRRLRDGRARYVDPASDVLPFTPVFLSIQDPETSPAGRDLLAVTPAAAKKRPPIRVAVITSTSDLGLIQSLWRRPQPYSEFLGKELFNFGRYNGTLVVAMPNGYGVYGPQAGKGKAALAKLPKPEPATSSGWARTPPTR